MRKLFKYLKAFKMKYDYWFDRFAPAIVYILTASIIFIILLFYRFDYRLVPVDYDTVPDWTAIGTVTSIVLPTFLSFIAICISLATARQQNKVALFEKRYAVYKEVSDFLIETIEIENILNENYSEIELKEKLNKILYARLNIDKDYIDKNDIREYHKMYLVKMGLLADKISFLYSDNISKRFLKLFEMSTDIITFKYIDEDIPVFKECNNNFWEYDIKDMEKHLKL